MKSNGTSQQSQEHIENDKYFKQRTYISCGQFRDGLKTHLLVQAYMILREPVLSVYLLTYLRHYNSVFSS